MKKSFKSLTIVLLLVTMLLTAVACGGEEKDEAKETTASNDEATEEKVSSDGEKYKVFLITMDQQDQHWVTLNQGAEKAVEELGNVDFQWLAPDVKDDNKQIESVNNAIAGGAQAIVIAANGPDSVTSVLKEAQAEGIIIVYVDSPANLEGFATFSTDNKAAGTIAGEEMIKALEDKGITEGTIGIVNINQSTQSTVDREAGFRKALEGTNFEILETQYAEGDAAKSQDAASNFITQGVVGLFGANEGATVGVGNSIKESGEDIIGVGFDKSDKILELIEDGYIIGAMAQNPDVMGYEGIKAAVAALQGETLDETDVDTGVSVISKDNIDDFR